LQQAQWRERRERALLATGTSETQPALGTVAVGAAPAFDLPAIGAQAQTRGRPMSQSQHPHMEHVPLPLPSALPSSGLHSSELLAPRRPFSEIVTHKSSPDMRGRFYRENGSMVGVAERVNMKPRAMPVVVKREVREWAVAGVA